VVIPNPQVTGVQGQSLVLQCTASGFPNPTITWHFNMRQIMAADAPRLSVTPDGGLIINGVVTNDDGLYHCVATNPAGSDMGTVNLTIYGKKLVPQYLFIVYPNNQSSIENIYGSNYGTG